MRSSSRARTRATKGAPCGFLIRTLVTALALWVADAMVDGISVSGSSAWANALTLIAVAVIFGLVNAVIKPIVKVSAACSTSSRSG